MTRGPYCKPLLDDGISHVLKHVNVVLRSVYINWETARHISQYAGIGDADGEY